MIDSKKVRDFYAFLINSLTISGTLGLCLVTLFMCLGIEVKAVDLPVHAVYEDQHNGKDVTSTADGNLFILDISAWNFNNPWSLTEGNVDRTKLTNIVFDSNNSSQVSNISISNDGKISGRKENYKHIIYYNGSNWCIVETYKVGSWYNENNNNFQWKQEDESALISILNNLAQDPNGGGGGGSSTWSVDISGCVFPSITAGDALDLSSVTGVVVKKDGTTQSSGFAGEWKLCDGSNLPSNTNAQTYRVKYVLTSGGTAESDCRDIEVSAGGGDSNTTFHIRCISSGYSDVIELNEGPNGCYYTESTTPLFYSHWRLEDADDNIVPLNHEFAFDLWGNTGQRYDKDHQCTTSDLYPLQHCGWDRTNSYSGNCSSYSGPYFTLYLYQKNGAWYASECCDGCAGLPHHVRSEADVNGRTRNLQVVNSGCYSVNETSNLHNGDWHLEDVYNNTLPLVAEFNFTTTGGQQYNNNPVSGYIYDELFADCWNYNDQTITEHCTLYIYNREGVWYASEDESKCQAAGIVQCLTLSLDRSLICGNPTIILDKACSEITSWTWQISYDGNNWSAFQENGTTYNVTNINNNNVYYRVVSGTETSNVVSVVKDGVVVAQNGNDNNTYSLTPISGCSTCAFAVPLTGGINQIQNGDWYFRTISGTRLNVVVDSDASFITTNGNGNFNSVNSGDNTARFYGFVYVYENGGVWHLSSKNPCHCISTSITGNISCGNATLEMTKECNDNVNQYKWQRWDESQRQWQDWKCCDRTITVSSNDLNGSRYVRACYAGNNWTWVYSDPVEVPYLPFELTSVYNVPSLTNVTSGAELEVSQIKSLCCNNFEITVSNTGNHGDWNGWAYLHAEGYEFFYAGENNANLDFRFVNNSGANIHYWEVLAVNSNLANHKFYIYVDESNKKIFVSSYNDERVIGFNVENADNFPCDDMILSLATEPCSTIKYQWFANVDGNIHDIPGATGKTLTVTKEMYEEYGYTNVYGIKVGGNDWDQYNSNYRQREANFGWMIPSPSITGANGVSISKIVTLCCDANGGKLYRVDYSGTGQMQFNGYTHVRINDDESGIFSTTNDGINVNNATSPLYVYVTGNKAFWSTNRPESYVMLNMTENVCNICSSGGKSISVNIDYSYNNSNDGDFKNSFGLQNPTFTWEGSNNGYDWTAITGTTGSTLSGEAIDTYKQFRVSLPMGCETLSAKTTIDCGSTYPSISISGTLRKCQTGTLSSTINNLSYINCPYTLELQESEDENIWTAVKSTDYSVSGNIITINNISSSYYRYVMNVNGYQFYSNSIKSRDVAGVDIKVSYNKSLVYGVDHVNEVEFVVIPSDLIGYWEKLEDGVWKDARELDHISGAGTTKLKYTITDNNHKAIFRFFATEKCTRSEAVELKINEIDPVCANEGAIIFSFNGMNAGQFAAQKSATDPYMFIRPQDSRCYDNFPQNMHNSHAYPTGDGRVTYLGIEDCSRIGKPSFPTAKENVFGQENAYYISNRNAMVQYGGEDAVIPPSYFDNDMYYLWWHGGQTYQSNQNVTLPKVYPMMGIQYPSEIASGSTGKISVRFWLITDGLEGENPCHFGFFSDRHGSKTVAEDGTLVSTLEENPFYNQNCTLTCEATGQTWNMEVNNSMMANNNNNDCLTEVKVSDAQPGWYTMTAEFKMDGMLTGNDCPVFYPMVLPYSNKVGVAVEYLISEMTEVEGQEVQHLPVKPSICISAETACTSDAVSLFVKDLNNLGTSVQNVTIKWYDESNPNTPLNTQSVSDIAGNGVARFDTQFPEGVSYVNYRCEVEIEGNNGQMFTYKNYVQVGRDSKCYDCVYIGEDIENVVYTKETEIRVLTSNVDLPFGVQYVWQWSDKRYNSESKWIDIPSNRYTLVDGGMGIKLNLIKEDFEDHPYIRVVVKENDNETHCSSNAIHLSPMETKCSWEIKGVQMINPQEYEVKFATKYRIVFHVENNEDWIDEAPSFTMKDIQSETVKNVVCVDKDIDGNWYYDVQAASDYQFTITQFCTDFSVKDPNYKSIIVRAIRECQSATGTVTRVWYDDFGRFFNPSNTPYPTITPNGNGGYNFSSTTSINPNMGFDSYVREIEIDGITTPSPVYNTDDHAFAMDQTGALTSEVKYVTDLGEGCWGVGGDYVKYHVNDGSYAIVYNAAMGSCIDWGVMTEDHTPNEEHGGMLFINMPPRGGTVYSGTFKTKCREAVAIVSCYVANANQKEGKIPCNVTFKIINQAGDTLARYHSGDIFTRYQSDPAYQENPWTHLTFRVPLAASYQAEYYNYTFEIVS